MIDKKTINDITDLKDVIEGIYKTINGNAIKKDEGTFAKEREKIVNNVLAVFDQVFLNEGATYGDIKYLGMGATSYVFAVKSKVIKVGFERYTNKIKNNPYILQPVFRKSFNFKGKTLEGLFVEVTERVKACKTSDDVSDDELYKLYASFRDIGLEWVDVEPWNVGRLLKDNIIHWQLPTVFEHDFIDGDIEELRKAGDLVVLDTDFIYEGMAPEEMFNCYEDDEWGFIPTVREFRDRYAKSKSHKK